MRKVGADGCHRLERLTDRPRCETLRQVGLRHFSPLVTPALDLDLLNSQYPALEAVHLWLTGSGYIPPCRALQSDYGKNRRCPFDSSARATGDLDLATGWF